MRGYRKYYVAIGTDVEPGTERKAKTTRTEMFKGYSPIEAITKARKKLKNNETVLYADHYMTTRKKGEKK